MNIRTLSALSGLSRAQIDQIISRYGIEPHAKPKPGLARNFTRGDAFLLTVAGKLSALGLNQRQITNALGDIVCKVDPDTFEQLEAFPGQHEFAARGESAWVIFYLDGKNELVPEFVADSLLKKAADRLGVLIAIEAGSLAHTIDRLEAVSERGDDASES